MVLDGHSGRSRGFAFVYYKNIEDATEVPMYIYRITVLVAHPAGIESERIRNLLLDEFGHGSYD
jgi:hypothetical protein